MHVLKTVILATAGAFAVKFVMESSMNAIAHQMQSGTRSVVGCRTNYRSFNSMRGNCAVSWPVAR